MATVAPSIELTEPPKPDRRNMAERLRARFEPLGGADDLKVPHRERISDPPFTFGSDDLEAERPV